MAFKFPFTNYHELNLTWVLDQLKQLFERSDENVTVIENYDGRLTAVETELPSVADTAQDAAQTAAAAASLAQTAKATADTAQENAIQAQSAAGTARQEAQDAQTAAASAIQAAQQAQATAQNFDGRITQAENDASEALEASQSFENRVQAAINTANNAASTATNAQGIATNANQNAAAALDKVGNLNDLKTSAKNNLVTALNEVSDKSVKDVQINGQSIVASGIASIPLASSSRLGVIRPLQNGGVTIDAQGRISTVRASLDSIKTASANYPVIVPSNQHSAVFYGLARAAGDSTQAASSNEVGAYTEQAKAAILAMLGVTDQLNAKQNAPTAAGTAGQVLGLNNSLQPVWVDQTGGDGSGETWYTAELSAADYDSTNKRIIFDAGSGKKLKNVVIAGQIVNDGTQTSDTEKISIGVGITPNTPQFSVCCVTSDIVHTMRRFSFSAQFSIIEPMGSNMARVVYPQSFYYGVVTVADASLYVYATMDLQGTTRATNIYWNFNDPRYLKIELPTWVPQWAYIKIFYTLQ